MSKLNVFSGVDSRALLCHKLNFFLKNRHYFCFYEIFNFLILVM